MLVRIATELYSATELGCNKYDPTFVATLTNQSIIPLFFQGMEESPFCKCVPVLNDGSKVIKNIISCMHKAVWHKWDNCCQWVALDSSIEVLNTSPSFKPFKYDKESNICITEGIQSIFIRLFTCTRWIVVQQLFTVCM